MSRTKGAYSSELKEIPVVAGVYMITNLINGKVYIGQSSNVKRRIWNERCPSYCPKSCPRLKEAMKEYGKHNFKYELLVEEPDKAKRLHLEEHYISFYDSTNPNKGYNIQEGTKKKTKEKKIDDLLASDLPAFAKLAIALTSDKLNA